MEVPLHSYPQKDRTRTSAVFAVLRRNIAAAAVAGVAPNMSVVARSHSQQPIAPFLFFQKKKMRWKRIPMRARQSLSANEGAFERAHRGLWSRGRSR